MIWCQHFLLLGSNLWLQSFNQVHKDMSPIVNIHSVNYWWNNNFHEIWFWILSGTDNKKAGTICFEVKIPRKIQNNVMEWFHQKLMECTLLIWLWFVQLSGRILLQKSSYHKIVSHIFIALSFYPRY